MKTKAFLLLWTTSVVFIPLWRHTRHYLNHNTICFCWCLDLSSLQTCGKSSKTALVSRWLLNGCKQCAKFATFQKLTSLKLHWYQIFGNLKKIYIPDRILFDFIRPLYINVCKHFPCPTGWKHHMSTGPFLMHHTYWVGGLDCFVSLIMECLSSEGRWESVISDDQRGRGQEVAVMLPTDQAQHYFWSCNPISWPHEYGKTTGLEIIGWTKWRITVKTCFF